jgi:hypothetical protein
MTKVTFCAVVTIASSCSGLEENVRGALMQRNGHPRRLTLRSCKAATSGARGGDRLVIAGDQLRTGARGGRSP